MRILETAGKNDRRLDSFMVVEPNRQMQVLLRTMLSSYGIRSVRMFADTERAAHSMLVDPPGVVLLDWEAGPYQGAKFLKMIRHQNMSPVCMVPIIVMFSEARQRWVERALRLGAQGVLVKPMSPSTLLERIMWVLDGGSALTLRGERYVVAGMDSRLEDERERQGQLKLAREYQESQFGAIAAIQNDIDQILHGLF